MSEQLVTDAGRKELDKFMRFDAFIVVDADIGIAEMKKHGDKVWEVLEVDGNVKAPFVCRDFASVPSVELAPATSYATTVRVIDLVNLAAGDFYTSRSASRGRSCTCRRSGT